jgi:hypothetical protein
MGSVTERGVRFLLAPSLGLVGEFLAPTRCGCDLVFSADQSPDVRLGPPEQPPPNVCRQRMGQLRHANALRLSKCPRDDLADPGWLRRHFLQAVRGMFVVADPVRHKHSAAVRGACAGGEDRNALLARRPLFSVFTRDKPKRIAPLHAI